MDDEVVSDRLAEIYFDKRGGFGSLKNLIAKAEQQGIMKDDVKKWYKSQPVNQIIVPRRNPIAYHKTIGDGDGYQMDIMFLPFPLKNNGYTGILTFINTSTRKAYVYEIKTRTTEEILGALFEWLTYVKKTWGNVKTITTDNEFFRNRVISNFFTDNHVEHYVETSGEHSKLGLINRFHRTYRDLLNKMMTHNKSKRWIDFTKDAIINYNNRIHRTLGKAPEQMKRDDIPKLNQNLRIANRDSVSRMLEFNEGDPVRYLLKKSVFGKGGKRYSNEVFIVTGREGFNIQITDEHGNVLEKKYWELMKI